MCVHTGKSYSGQKLEIGIIFFKLVVFLSYRKKKNGHISSDWENYNYVESMFADPKMFYVPQF